MVVLLQWVIVTVGIIAALYAFVAAVWLSIHPGELNEDHPKRLIFKEHR